MLAAPLNVAIVRALADGPKQQIELRRDAGSPAQTTLRAQLKRLVEIGALEKHRRNRFPGTLEYELTPAGRDLASVADALERWLEFAPEGSLPLGDNAARAAIKALAGGWSSTMLRALAARPLSLTELSGVIAALSYPSLERRLSAMRLADLIRSDQSAAASRGNPYAVTEWLRQAIGPLLAAARWERKHGDNDAMPIEPIDVETIFLLTAPLLRLRTSGRGLCRLVAEIPNGSGRLAGATLEVKDGRASSCTTRLSGDYDASALGSPTAWLDALIERDGDRLELGGDQKLARDVLASLSVALFASPPQTKRTLDAAAPIRHDGSN